MNYMLALQKHGAVGKKKSNHFQAIVCRVQPRPLNANTWRGQGQIGVPWHHVDDPDFCCVTLALSLFQLVFYSGWWALIELRKLQLLVALMITTVSALLSVEFPFCSIFGPAFFHFFAPNLPTKKTKNNIMRYLKLFQLQFTILMAIASRSVDCTWVLHRKNPLALFHTLQLFNFCNSLPCLLPPWKPSRHPQLPV